MNESEDATGNWLPRSADLSSIAGSTITDVALTVEKDTGSGPWSAQYADIAIISTDGSVHAIDNGVTSASANIGPTGGVSNAQIGINMVSVQNIATHFYLGDHLGSTSMEFAAGGWPVWQGQYAPFGQELDSASTSMHYKFTGKERDSETGNDYFGARYYASTMGDQATMGRFMSPDPSGLAYASLGNPQSINPYSYVLNNPLEFVDPTGLWHCVFDDSGGGAADRPGASGGTGTTEAECDHDHGVWMADKGDAAKLPRKTPQNTLTVNVHFMVDDFRGMGVNLSINGPADNLFGDRSAAPSNTSWYQSCTAKALGNGALSVGVDALGFIPGEKDVQAAVEIGSGTFARQIGNWIGYRGIVADQFGARSIARGSQTVKAGGLGYSLASGDWVSLGLNAAGLIPGLNEVAAVASIGYDAYKTVKAVASCP